jgi:Rieske Fe-S protein
MNRKEFLKKCGFACLGLSAGAHLMQSCAGAKSLSAKISGDDLIVPLKDFELSRGGQLSHRKYLIVHHDLLQYPICVYRFSAKEFTALLMKCSHQGAELTAYGDKLVCAAHGSEFTNAGDVATGPADKSLRAFPVRISSQQLNISLKAI